MKKKVLIITIVILVFLEILIVISPGEIKLADTNPKPIPTKNETVSKLEIEDLTVGTGTAVKSGDTVVMNYKGTLKDGTEFDNSYKRGSPFETTIGIGKVIKGWDEGIPGMKIGGKRKLTIPADLGYGEIGAPPSIPPNAVLVFEVELLEIK